jgi:ubiquinone/menaquinone biosynthesis C-methylase UbiE
MAHGHKFDVAKLEKLRDPERLRWQSPAALWAVVGGEPVETLVDIGAGIGFFAIPFARHMPHGKVYACDISAEMLEHLAEALRRESVANVEPVLMEEVAVPLADGLADAVLMVNLHHELDHPEASLREGHRLLRAGGRIAIVDWKPEQTPQGPPVRVRIAAATVAEQLRAAGFGEITHQPLLPYHYFLTARK